MTEILKSIGSFESFDGTQIYYESRGEGEPLVLIYGIACLMNHWHHQVTYFSKNYNVILLDIRGHHKSGIPKDKSNLTISAVAKDVEGLLKHLNIKKAHFAGHSFGVPVLIEFAANNPQLVKSLTLVNGFSENPIKGMFGLDVVEPLYQLIKTQYENNRALLDTVWKFAINNPVSMWATGLAGGFNLKLTQFKDIEIYAKGVSQIPLDVFLPMFEDLMSFHGDNLLRKISSATLILGGESDFVTPIKFQEAMADKIKNSEFVLVPYGSHCTQLDFPDYVNLRLEKHMQENK